MMTFADELTIQDLSESIKRKLSHLMSLGIYSLTIERNTISGGECLLELLSESLKSTPESESSAITKFRGIDILTKKGFVVQYKYA